MKGFSSDFKAFSIIGRYIKYPIIKKAIVESVVILGIFHRIEGLEKINLYKLNYKRKNRKMLVILKVIRVNFLIVLNCLKN